MASNRMSGMNSAAILQELKEITSLPPIYFIHKNVTKMLVEYAKLYSQLEPDPSTSTCHAAAFVLTKAKIHISNDTVQLIISNDAIKSVSNFNRNSIARVLKISEDMSVHNRDNYFKEPLVLVFNHACAEQALTQLTSFLLGKISPKNWVIKENPSMQTMEIYQNVRPTL